MRNTMHRIAMAVAGALIGPAEALTYSAKVGPHDARLTPAVAAIIRLVIDKASPMDSVLVKGHEDGERIKLDALLMKDALNIFVMDSLGKAIMDVMAEASGAEYVWAAGLLPHELWPLIAEKSELTKPHELVGLEWVIFLRQRMPNGDASQVVFGLAKDRDGSPDLKFARQLESVVDDVLDPSDSNGEKASA